MFVFIFTGGTAPEPKIAENFFNGIFSSKEEIFIIAADSGLKTFEEYKSFFNKSDFNPKLILGDWDSLEDKSILEKYDYCKIQNHIIDKDYTDTELALYEAHKLIEKKYEGVQKIILIGAGGGERIDHLLSVFDLFSTELKPDIWLSGKQFLYYLKENSKTEIHNLKIDDMISLLRTTQSRTGGKITSKGFKWESDLFRNEGLPSISNRISPEFSEKNLPVELTVEEGDFVLAVPFSADVNEKF